MTGMNVAEILDLLRQGEPVYLTDRPRDPAEYSLFDTSVTVRQAEPGRIRFQQTMVCNDGSCTSAYQDDTLDEDAASERLTGLIERGHVFDWIRRA